MSLRRSISSAPVLRPDRGKGPLPGRRQSEAVHRKFVGSRPVRDRRGRRGLGRRRHQQPRQADGGASGRHVEAAREGGRRHDRSAGQLHAAVLAALPGELRRATRLQEGRWRRRLPGRPGSRPEPADADERRQDLGVQAPQGDQVLERQDRDADRRGGFVPADLQGQEPDLRRVLRRHRRRQGLPREAGRLHAEGRRDRERQGGHGDVQPDRPGSGVQVPPGGTSRQHPAGEHAAEGRRHQADPQHGRLLLRVL